jgi:hypothetical protein
MKAALNIACSGRVLRQEPGTFYSMTLDVEEIGRPSNMIELPNPSCPTPPVGVGRDVQRRWISEEGATRKSCSPKSLTNCRAVGAPGTIVWHS